MFVCGELTIPYSGLIYYCFFNKKITAHSFDQPSHSDFVQQDLSNGQDNLNETVRDLSKRIDVIETSDKYITGVATNNFGYYLMNLCKKDDPNSSDEKLGDDSSVVVSNDIENYTMPELAEKKLLIFYEQNGQEIYFYGQCSQNNKWDGDCIINVYNKSNNELVLVTDAVFEDGTLKNYRQAFQHEKDGVKLWNISDRTCTDDGNEGETWIYYREEGKRIFKDSSKDTVEPKDIYSVTQVKNSINTSLEGFYHGITSNGLYNDTTGDAYLVKFSNDGTVRTLYTGNFLDGEFEDETNEAWYISRKEEIIDSKYAYYKSIFHKGEPENDIPTESNLTKERILQIISYKFYKPVLKWYGFDNA